ncbi:HalOD1 output domain-containing protein (plasmid) [Haloplanus ruber]|uniref:HalOD1 output domain-containing protein n=1 Tax=Haloplanus ruber TaxID=869892 RepID=A0ABD6D4E2_9EURY|nr:HalOD1 output domain-containing protein [Haloplanus ruber]
MAPSSPKDSDVSPNLLVEIVNTLESQGLASDSYQLYDAVDVEALERILISSSSDVEVRFTVEDIQIVVTKDGATVLLDKPDGPPDK